MKSDESELVGLVSLVIDFIPQLVEETLILSARGLGLLNFYIKADVIMKVSDKITNEENFKQAINAMRNLYKSLFAKLRLWTFF